LFCVTREAGDVNGTFMLAWFGMIFLVRQCRLKKISAQHFSTLTY